MREQGWAESEGEREPDLSALAAPVTGRDGALVAILGLQGPARFSAERRRAVLPAAAGRRGGGLARARRLTRHHAPPWTRSHGSSRKPSGATSRRSRGCRAPPGRRRRSSRTCRAWARRRDLAMRRDAAGNLVVRVPATDGRADAPVVVLQGHLDMVCEREPDSPYDPAHGRIRVVRDGDWIHAEGTTLGADNGVAIAAMMAVAEDGRAPHGPLDLLMTVDEERGLAGAAGLDPELLAGDLLLNLDSEEDATLTVGCAGGVDTIVRLRRAARAGGRAAAAGGRRRRPRRALGRRHRARPRQRDRRAGARPARGARAADRLVRRRREPQRDPARRHRGRGRGRGRARGDRGRGRGDRRRAPRHRPRPPDHGGAGRGRRGRRRVVRVRQRPDPRPDRRDPGRPARHERRVPGRRRDELVARHRPHGGDDARAALALAQRERRRAARGHERDRRRRAARGAPRSRPATTTPAGGPTRTPRCSPPRARCTPSCSARART